MTCCEGLSDHVDIYSNHIIATRELDYVTWKGLF